MDISHIVFAGCSFTYCQGLELEYAWPTLIGKHFNANIVNLAVPGVGNDNVHRRLYEYIYKNKNYVESTPLVIVGFSDPWRKEVWSKNHYLTSDFEDYAPVSYPNNKPNTYHEYAMIENWNEEDFYRKSLIYKLSLINLFKALNIPYLFTDVFSQYPNEAAFLKVKEKFGELITEVENKFYIKYDYKNSVYETARHMKNLPCGHYGIEACQKITENIVEAVNRLYPNINYSKNIPYLKLSDFIKFDKYHQKFPIWCSLEEQSDILP